MAKAIDARSHLGSEVDGFICRRPLGDRLVVPQTQSQATDPEDDVPETRLLLVTNWFEELRERMGGSSFGTALEMRRAQALGDTGWRSLCCTFVAYQNELNETGQNRSEVGLRSKPDGEAPWANQGEQGGRRLIRTLNQ